MKRSFITRWVVVAGAISLSSVVADENKTNLVEMLVAVQGDPNVTLDMRPLSHEWIGDITDENGKIERMRLEKGRITAGEIVLLRTYPNGSYLGSDAPVFIRTVPSDEKLQACSTVAEIQKLLGPGQGGFSGWGGPNGLHSSHSWVCFGPSGDDRLTYLSVFAHTSFNDAQRAQGITNVDELIIRRGELRPADPKNPEERKIYLSGADKFAAEEAEKAAGRARYPQPLRDLILADEHPDDPDLKHLSAAIQSIRDHPSPKLFAQLVREMHEGTLRIRSLLDYILINEHDILELKAWGAKEEAIAVGACIDALVLAEDGARDHLVEILLRVCGGGKIEMEGATGGRSIEVIPSGGGYQMTFGGASDPLPLAQVQKRLRDLYAKSREGQASPPER